VNKCTLREDGKIIRDSLTYYVGRGGASVRAMGATVPADESIKYKGKLCEHPII
jgi:hypothetical protein